MNRFILCLATLIALSLEFIPLQAGLLAQVVSSVSPAQNALNVQPNTTIQVTFSTAMMTSPEGITLLTRLMTQARFLCTDR